MHRSRDGAALKVPFGLGVHANILQVDVRAGNCLGAKERDIMRRGVSCRYVAVRDISDDKAASTCSLVIGGADTKVLLLSAFDEEVLIEHVPHIALCGIAMDFDVGSHMGVQEMAVADGYILVPLPVAHRANGRPVAMNANSLTPKRQSSTKT